MGAQNNISYGISLVTARAVGAIAAVRPGERRQTFGAFLTLFGFMAGHALLETARDALFLARWPASRLPWVYLLIAVVALALTRSQHRLLRRFQTRHELAAWLFLSAVITFAFWVLVRWAWGWIFFGLYVWSGVLATLVVVRFWTVLANTFTVTQAKRLFAVVGSGSVMGAIAGSGFARVLTGLAPSRHLVLAAALAFLVTSLAPRLLTRRHDDRQADHVDPSLPSDPFAVARLIWNRPYLKRVALLILLATVTFTLVDYVFKSTVDRTVPAAAMGEFFSSVYFVLNVASLLVQLFAVSWLVRRLGINAVQSILPLSFLLCAAGYLASAGLAAALLLKAVDGTLRYSLYRTGTELLFVALSVDVRGRVKAVIDVVGQRGGQALASLVILTLLTVTHREWAFAAVAGIVALAWLRLAVDLRTHYVNVFRESLRETVERTRFDLPALDVASFEALLETLNESDDRRVAAALDLLAAQGKSGVIPALVLYHPSTPVVAHALDLFVDAQRVDCLPILQRLIHHTDAALAAAALNAHSVLSPDEAVLRKALKKGATDVKVTAVVSLLSHGWMDHDEGLEVLDAALAAEQGGTWLALASAIRRHPEPYFDQPLIRLIQSRDKATRLTAIQAMGRVGSVACVPALIHLMAERAMRADAGIALVAIGPAALPALLEALNDQDVPHGIRLHLPRAIAAFGTPKAANLLLRRLLVETDGMIRFKVLRALGHLRAQHPGLPLDEVVLTHAFRYTLNVAFNYMSWRHTLERGALTDARRNTVTHAALIALLRDKQMHAVERLFRLLNLIANDEDFARIHHGLQSVRPETRAGSRELIEHLVVQQFRDPLLTLIDDLYEPLEITMHDKPDGYDETLLSLARGPLESVSAFATAQIAALGLRQAGAHLEQRPEFSKLHADVVRRAHALLSGAEP